jgi:hypothetical protein
MCHALDVVIRLQGLEVSGYPLDDDSPASFFMIDIFRKGTP